MATILDINTKQKNDETKDEYCEMTIGFKNKLDRTQVELFLKYSLYNGSFKNFCDMLSIHGIK